MELQYIHCYQDKIPSNIPRPLPCPPPHLPKFLQYLLLSLRWNRISYKSPPGVWHLFSLIVHISPTLSMPLSLMKVWRQKEWRTFWMRQDISLLNFSRKSHFLCWLMITVSHTFNFMVQCFYIMLCENWPWEGILTTLASFQNCQILVER